MLFNLITQLRALSTVLPTVFYLCNVADHNISHRNLDNLSSANDSEFLFLLYAALEAPELLLFTPVVKRRHQHHADN